MIPPRHSLKYISLLVLAAVISLMAALSLLSVFVGLLTRAGTGEKQGRNPAVAQFAPPRGRPSITPMHTQPVVPTATPIPPTATLPNSIPDAYRGLLTNGSRTENKVALTFDLCQTEENLAGFDTEIIRILNETGTPATFFLGGLWMRDHQAETRELAGNPLFELGNHSWSHQDFSAISNEQIQQEVILTQQMMYDLLGYQTNLFRLPFGTYNDEALNVINDNGLYVIQWDDVSGDPDPNIDAKSMTRWVLQQAQPGSIIIMHANGRGWHTAEALPRIIQALRDQGYTPVTISELLQIQPYK